MNKDTLKRMQKELTVIEAMTIIAALEVAYANWTFNDTTEYGTEVLRTLTEMIKGK